MFNAPTGSGQAPGIEDAERLAGLLAHKLFRSFWSRPRFLLRRFRCFHLRFDVLAFPARCHSHILTQIGLTMARFITKRCEKTQAPAARRWGRTGSAGRITPRMVLAATRARCSAKTPR